MNSQQQNQRITECKYTGDPSFANNGTSKPMSKRAIRRAMWYKLAVAGKGRDQSQTSTLNHIVLEQLGEELKMREQSQAMQQSQQQRRGVSRTTTWSSACTTTCDGLSVSDESRNSSWSEAPKSVALRFPTHAHAALPHPGGVSSTPSSQGYNDGTPDAFANAMSSIVDALAVNQQIPMLQQQQQQQQKQQQQRQYSSGYNRGTAAPSRQDMPQYVTISSCLSLGFGTQHMPSEDFPGVELEISNNPVPPGMPPLPKRFLTKSSGLLSF
jgi:hypothetical protein